MRLALSYNSKVWTKIDDHTIVFDHNHGWPAPGWSLGFGKVERMGSYGVALEDPDGTIHSFAGTVNSYASGFTNFITYTTDGTFIDYFFQLLGGAFSTGYAKWPNGTVIDYGAASADGNEMYPTRIMDANGNYITITYRNNSGPQIDTIVDTLGRAIEFFYDSGGFLTAIVAPGLQGNDRVVVRLQYKWLQLNAAFSSQLQPLSPDGAWVIAGIFLPGTATGYWFGDANSYSPYGMIAKVSRRRGMTFSASSLTDQGSLTAGSVDQIYNYPTGPDATLTDAPTYTQLGDTWARIDVAPAVTSFSAAMDANPRRLDVFYPDNSHVTQLSYNDQGNFDDALVFKQITSDASGKTVRTVTTTWEKGDEQSPRVKQIQVTDELGQTTSTTYSYLPLLTN